MAQALTTRLRTTDGLSLAAAPLGAAFALMSCDVRVLAHKCAKFSAASA